MHEMQLFYTVLSNISNSVLSNTTDKSAIHISTKRNKDNFHR